MKIISRYFVLILVALVGQPAFADLLDEELAEPSKEVEPDLGGTEVKPVEPDSPPKSTESPPPAAKKKAGNKQPSVTPPQTSTVKTLAPATNKTKRKEQEKKEPIKYQSNGLSGLRDKGTLELLDNVVVSQGTLKLEADKAKVEFNEETDEVDKVTADGHIKMFRYDQDSGEQIKAFGDRVIFLNAERKVILEGNARLFRGPNLMRGNRLIYELDTGWIRAEKVEGELHPEEDK